MSTWIDGDVLGDDEGDTLGLLDGDMLGLVLGLSDGAAVESDGEALGEALGKTLGLVVGDIDGATENSQRAPQVRCTQEHTCGPLPSPPITHLPPF